MRLFAIFSCLVLLSLSALNSLKACDGCSFFNYNTRIQNHYIGVFWSYKVFNGYNSYQQQHRFKSPITNGRLIHEPEENGMLVNKNEFDYEAYHSFDYRLQWQLGSNLSLSMNLPYKMTSIYYKEVINFPEPLQDTLITVQGWGNPSLNLHYYKLFEGKSEDTQHLISLTGGLFLPLGSTNTNRADPVLQPSTRTWGALSVLTYSYFYKQFTARLGFQAEYNAEGVESYQKGQAFRPFVNLERSFSLTPTLALVPQIGAETLLLNSDRYQNNKVSLSGRTTYLLNTGMGIDYENFIVQGSFSKNIFEKTKGNQIGTSGMLNLNILYQF